jgi:inward rectifier potassium channel
MGIAASAIASLEALTGLMSFALITGLLFARFAKSPGRLMFAEKAVIAPFMWNGQEVPAFMFRTANPFRTNLMNMKAQITISLVEKLDENGAEQRRFYPLTLERSEIFFHPLGLWCIRLMKKAPFMALLTKICKEVAPNLWYY